MVTPRQQRALQAAVMGVLCHDGRNDISIVCSCGLPAAAWHRDFTCPVTQAIADEALGNVVRNTNYLQAIFKPRKDELQCAWCRGILPYSLIDLAPPVPDEATINTETDVTDNRWTVVESNHTMYSDGAGPPRYAPEA